MKSLIKYLLLVFLGTSIQIQAQNFQIFGDAFQIPTVSNSTCSNADNCFTLTANSNWQSGAVWDLNLIDLTQPFDATFCMYMGADDNGADGFAFVLRDPASSLYGAAGGGLGFGSNNGVDAISPSVAIEFDSFYNPDFFDIPEDHTALVLNGIMNVPPAVSAVPLLPNGANVEDNNFHSSRIVWNPTTQVISMYFDGFLRFTYNNDIINNVFGGNPNVIWGFTASTGGLSNLQQICFPKVILDLQDYEICTQGSVLISYPMQDIQSYTWTHPNGQVIIDWNDSMGIPLTETSFYATESGSYTLTVVLNNVTYTASSIVTIIPPPEQVNLDLCESSQNINLFSLFSSSLPTDGEWTGPSTLAGNHLGTFVPGTNLEGVYLYSTNSSSICPNDNQITVSYHKVAFNPQINIVPCTETEYEIELNPVMSNGQTNFTYTWSSINANVTSNQNLAEIVLSTNALINVQIISNDVFACQFDTIINLTHQTNPTFSLGPDLHICTGQTITLTAQGTWSNFLWSNNATTQSITASEAGIYSVEVSFGENCSFSDEIEVFISDKPEITLLPFDPISCAPFLVSFEAIVSNPQVILTWNFGDGSIISNNLTPNHNYINPGIYDLTLIASIGNNCQETLFLEEAIQVINRPVANFYYTILENTGSEVKVQFYNNSSFYSELIWDFSSTESSSIENPVITFNSKTTNTFEINLTATNDFCSNDITKTIVLPGQVIYYVPNTFTPDGNSFNNKFEPVFTEGIVENSYHLSIYNRWGEILFESFNLNVGWDGTYGSQIVKEGIYVWTIEFVEEESKEKRLLTGYVNLMK
jgi:gliding motility-associated-like protein